MNYLHRSGEDLLLLKDLANKLGKRYQSFWRLTVEGKTGVAGKKVYLEHVFTETGIKSSVESYYRFLDNLNDPSYKGLRI